MQFVLGEVISDTFRPIALKQRQEIPFKRSIRVAGIVSCPPGVRLDHHPVPSCPAGELRKTLQLIQNGLDRFCSINSLVPSCETEKGLDDGKISLPKHLQSLVFLQLWRFLL